MVDYDASPRELLPAIVAALSDMPVVVLSGARQSGKTTLLRTSRDLAERKYETLDDFATLSAARSSPDVFVRRDVPLTIDEAQRAPELLVAIKAEVDRNRRPGRFLLSGSANLALLSHVSESLAGRAIHLELSPMTGREIGAATATRPALLDLFGDVSAAARSAPPFDVAWALRGGFPSVALGHVKRPSVWFRGYEQTYLERDVRALARVGDVVEFRNLVRLAALRTSQVLNLSDLARDAKLPVSTATRHLALLEASFLVRRVPPFLRSRTSRLVKSPKLYAVDSGLAAHLAGVTDLGADEPLRGPLVETFVAENLRAIAAAHLPDAAFSYFHVQGRYEVDIVIELGRKVVGIEVKAASRFGERDLAGLRALHATTPGVHACVLAHGGTESVQLGEKLWAIPIGCVLA